MKKLLEILVLGLLWCGNVNAVEILADNKTVNDYVKDDWYLHSVIQGDTQGNLVYTLIKDEPLFLT